ncbi:MAG: S8 family serine peptidase [Chloroflexi bacterium]|nr:S8 family serine peptidase [Chloroflexota bacterium]
MQSRALRFVLALSATILMLNSGPALTTAQGPTPEKGYSLVSKSSGKLTSRLEALAQSPTLRSADAQTQAQILSLPAQGPGSLLKDDRGRLLVYIRTGDLSASNLQTLANAGATVVHVAQAYGVMTALVDATDLNTLAGLQSVQSIQEEYTPGYTGQPIHVEPQQVNDRNTNAPQACGAQTSEGDTQLNAATARTNHSVDGSGVKVGVLSDSYDRKATAVTHAANDIASGDLPGAGNPCSHLTAVSVISESISTSVGDEGRAMLQIVHDLVPGATLGFASAWNGLYQFADNIRNLRTWGANVIVDDIYYYAEPLFQDGPVAVAISDVVGLGAMYFTSAGNHNYLLGTNNIGSYEAPAYRPTTCPTGLPAYETSCHDFNPGAGVDNASSVTLASGGYLLLTFQWAQPWFGVATDLDIYVLDSSNTAVAYSESNNLTTQRPFEILDVQNSTGSTQTYRIVIGRYTAGGGNTGTPRIKYILDQSSSGVQSVEYPASSGGDIVGPTVGGHSASPHALSVAAAPYNNDNAPESFSSLGPAAHYFGPVIGATPATAISPLALQQPDFTATDGGCNTFFGSFSSGCYRFYGTSAAAPHAAAVAALMKQKANQMSIALNQSNVKMVLQSTARTMSGGTINSVGAGLIDADAAVGWFNLTLKVYVPIVRR